MVFSSIPAYLDPANWQQAAQPNHQVGGSSIAATLLLPNHPPPPPPQPHGGGAGSIRPGSMADRARIANIPMQEMALKCPRCESTNTKFCYFNNYSLSQPRHFCKTCRRYWTRGGALRNVPVGGGCRRNKRSKGSGGGGSSSSKSSPGNSVDMPTSSGNSSSGGISSNTAADILGLGPGTIPPLRFMSPLHHHHHHHLFADHHNHQFPSSTDDQSIGLNYGSMLSGHHIGGECSLGTPPFQMGSGLATGGVTAGSSLLSMSGLEQWRFGHHHQLPFFGGSLDSTSSGMLPFEIEGHEAAGSSRSSNKMMLQVQQAGQLVKMEDSNNNNNNNQDHMSSLSRQFLGMTNNNNNIVNQPAGVPAAGISTNDLHLHNHNNDQYWNSSSTGGGVGAPMSWTDLSGFSSSSTSNAL